MTQLPVTKLTPYVYMPIPEGFPDKLPVLDPLGSFIFFADETLARALVARHQVRIIRPNKNKQMRALQALGPLDDDLQKMASRKHGFGLPHRKETDTNPARVWTQDKLGNTSARPDRMMPVDDSRARWCRKVCVAVVTSCLNKAA